MGGGTGREGRKGEKGRREWKREGKREEEEEEEQEGGRKSEREGGREGGSEVGWARSIQSLHHVNISDWVNKHFKLQIEHQPQPTPMQVFQNASPTVQRFQRIAQQ